jgi:hypothetical protein
MLRSAGSRHFSGTERIRDGDLTELRTFGRLKVNLHQLVIATSPSPEFVNPTPPTFEQADTDHIRDIGRRWQDWSVFQTRSRWWGAEFLVRNPWTIINRG